MLVNVRSARFARCRDIGGSGLRAALCSLTLLVAPVTAHAITVYVDATNPAASNSNPGTEALPYRTITAAVNATRGPGNSVRVKPAIYREQVTVQSAGAAGEPFVLQAVGNGVVINGADDRSNPASWAPVSGNVFVAASVTWSPLQVFMNGARLAASTAGPAQLPVNSYRYVSGTGLYVNAGGPNPGSQQIDVGRRLYGIRLSTKPYVEVRGFTIMRTEDRGIYLSSGSNYCVIANNVITYANKFGIGNSGSSNVTIEANTVSYSNDHGIQLSQMTSCMVRGNESFGNWRPNLRAANGIYLALTTSTTIAGNRLHDNQDTGLHFQDADNNFSLQNMSYNNGDHGYDHLSTSGVMHLGDIAYGNFKDGFSIEGNSPGNTVMNCIAVQNGLTSDEYDLWVDIESHSGFVSDYNIFWQPNDQRPIRIEGAKYATIAAYTAASGNDVHSIQLDPMFVSPGTGDFRLRPGSPAIDNANSAITGWPVKDTAGEVRLDDPSTTNHGAGSISFADRGAHEFVPPDAGSDHAPVVAAPAPDVHAEGSVVTMQVTAFDPDGDAISSLSANLQGLPASHNAVFVANSDHTSGTLTWTPLFTDARPVAYFVTFTAANALGATASTWVQVTNTDRAPVVSSPVTKSGAENASMAVFVSAADPDSGDHIVSLEADVSSLPPGANVSFTTNSSRTSGTLIWTPTYSDSGGPYPVRFTATNALSGRDTTLISVINVNRVPVVTAPATMTIGENAPLTFVVNATDPDGDAIASLTAAGLPVGATFSADSGNASGTFSWTPSFSDAGGPYDVTFTAGNLLGGNATTSITVTNLDRAPTVAAPANVNAFEGTPFTLTITAADPDGQTILALSASLAGLPPGSGAVFTPNATNTAGTLTWTPGFDDAPNTFVVNFSAANSSSGSASTAIHVGTIDRAPIIEVPATVAAAEGRPVSVPVTVSDPDGDPITNLSAELSGLPAGHNGVFTPAADNTRGTLTWTPGSGDFSGGSYTVTIHAVNALSASSTTVITVGRAPVISAQASKSVIEGNSLSFTVTASDPDGDAIASFDAAGLPAGATFVTNPAHSSGTFSWTPGFSAAPGPYSVTFTALNAFLSSAVTSIAVANADRAPVVGAPVKLEIMDGTLLTLDITAVDPDGDAITALTADLGGLPAVNDAVFTPNASRSGGTLTWTPRAGEAHRGPYRVTFTASNALTHSSSTTLTGDRTPVVVAPATALSTEGQPVTFGVTASDPDNEAIVSLVASALPAGATFVTDSLNRSGTFFWTPGFSAAPGPYTIVFSATNGLIGTSSTVVTVENVDRAPIVTAPAALAGNVGTLMTFTVSVVEPDNEPIASLSASGMPAGAMFTPNSTHTAGTFSWTPTMDSAVGLYTVTFAAENALSATAATSITADRPPVVTAPSAQTVAENAALSFSVFASDPDGEPISSLVATGLPAGATFITDESRTSGVFNWTPGFGDAPGPYTVTFTAVNTLNGVASAAITVENVDRAPWISAPPTMTLSENQPVSVEIDVIDADGDAINSLTANLSAFPPGHNAVFTTNPSKTRGTLTWTPTSNDGRSAPYTVTFTATNALHATSTTGITIVDAIVNLVSNPSFESNTTGWNGHAGATLARVAGGQSGSFAVRVTGPNSTATFGANDSPGIVTQTTAGARYRYSAWVRSASGTGQAQLRIREYAPSGALVGSIVLSPASRLSPVWQYLTVDHVAAGSGNQLDLQVLDTPKASGETFLLDNVVAYVSTSTAAPVVSVASAFTTTENSVVIVNVVASDADGDPIANLTADLSGLPAGHNAVFTPNANRTAGVLSWTPTFGDAPGPYTVSFTATNALSGTASTSIAVTNLDRAPVVSAPGSTSVAENAPIAFTVTASDPDGNAISSLAAANLPSGATFTPNAAHTSGTFAWTPGYSAAPGPYTVTFLATNALSGSTSTAVAVTNVDRAPGVTAPANRTGIEGSRLSFTVSASDPDGNAITLLSAGNLPAGATFTPNGTNTGGTFEWTPGAGDGPGPYTVTFTAANELSAGAATVITITEGDRPPAVSAPATHNGSEGSALSLTVTATDPDGDTITSLIAAGLPAGAVFTPSGDKTSGSITWTPGYSAAGPYTLTFTAANALSGTATTTLTVMNIDRAPTVAVPANSSATEMSAFLFTVSASDPDGDAITSLTASNLPAGATFSADGAQTSGTFAWTPGYDAAPGPYTVTFTAANALSGTSTTSVSVMNLDRAPVVSAPATADGAEGRVLSVTVTASDVDGEGMASLVASGLPVGATFTANETRTSGTLNWTPGYDVAGGPYTVTFTATNALSATTSTVLTVGNVDRSPVVSAPATQSGAENAPLAFSVTASDPDGETLAALTASNLPSGATFTPDSTHASGTFLWTPGFQDAGGPYTVTFTATNALTGSTATSVTIINSDRAPVVTVASTATGNEGEPKSVTVTASDADGDSIASLAASFAGLPAGNTAVFTPNASRTGGTLTWTPAWNDGRPAPYVVTFTATNALNGNAAVAITVNDNIVNLASNPSFEANLNGWGQNGGSTLRRVAGGYSGGFTCQASGPASNAVFGINDSPNIVNSTTGGTRYRYVARVRSASSTGQVRIKLREYTALGVQTGPVLYSAPVTLSSAWQIVSVDIVSSGSGRNIDFQVIDTPVTVGESFMVDDVLVYVVPAPGNALASRRAPDENGSAADPAIAPESLTPALPAVEFSASIGPNPARPTATLRLALTRAGIVHAKLYDVRGRVVRTLSEGSTLEPGRHVFAIDGRDDRGARLPAGVYFYRIEAAEGVRSGSFVIVN